MVLWSCDADNKKNIVAKVGSADISMEEIDALIQPELYESLFNTYYARKVMTDEIIAQQLLAHKAKEMGMSQDSLIAHAMTNNGHNKERFISENGLAHGVLDPERPGYVLPLNSERGRKVLDEAFGKYVLQQFVETLKKENKVEVFLRAPLPPSIELSEIAYHSLTGTKMKNVFWVFSDFTCMHCRDFYPVLELLQKKYGHQMEFRYTSMSGDISEAILLGEYAGSKGRFKEAMVSIFSQLKTGKFECKRIIEDLRLDYKSFRSFSSDSKQVERIRNNYQKLVKSGKFQATPTIVINNRIYYGDISFPELDKYIINYDEM